MCVNGLKLRWIGGMVKIRNIFIFTRVATVYALLKFKFKIVIGKKKRLYYAF